MMFRKVTHAVLATLVTTLPAHAQEQDPTEIWPNQVSRYAALPCVAGGPTQKDADIGAQLNTVLNNKMRGHMNGPLRVRLEGGCRNRLRSGSQRSPAQ